MLLFILSCSFTATQAVWAPYWRTELCDALDTYHGGYQQGNTLMCQAVDPSFIYGLNMDTGALIFNATGVQPETISPALDVERNVLYALEPIPAPYEGYNLTFFATNKSVKPDIWPKSQTSIYSGYMAAMPVVATRGVLKQWDGSGVGIISPSLKPDWIGEYEFPSNKYGFATTLPMFPIPSKDGPNKNPEGVISWIFDTTQHILYRLDGKTDPKNNSKLVAEWEVILSSNLSHEELNLDIPWISIQNRFASVWITAGIPHPMLKVFDVDTGEVKWEHILKDVTYNSTLQNFNMIASYAGDYTCSSVSNNYPPPPPPGVKQKRPTPNPHFTCLNIATKTQLYSLPFYHRMLHNDTWAPNEFAGTAISAGKLLITVALTYDYEKTKGYWIAVPTRIRAFDIATGKHEWDMPVSLKDYTYISADTRGINSFFVSFRENNTLIQFRDQ
eukprot:m.21094 g.21094  ORF g.21094 m.21094 type:complete len:445 (+) comp7030_c0_seq1:116-1450(+)